MTSEQFKQELKQEIVKSESKVTDIYKRRNDYIAQGLTVLPQFNKSLTIKNFANINGLYEFAKKHKELRGDQIEELVKQNASTFKFLNQFVNSMEDVVDDMRVHGMMYCVIVYNHKINKCQELGKIAQTKLK